MTKKAKRNLFEELKKGIEEIKSHKVDKATLCTYKVEKKPFPKVDAATIRMIREKFHMSRNVFALKLRVSPRTLEKWEQDITTPNDQAAALLLMAYKYPDTLKKLENI